MNKQKLPGIKINITERPKVVEKTLGFKQIYENRDLFKKLSFQIDLDEDKINDMIERYKRNKDYISWSARPWRRRCRGYVSEYDERVRWDSRFGKLQTRFTTITSTKSRWGNETRKTRLKTQLRIGTI